MPAVTAPHIANRKSQIENCGRRRAYTLIEMLTTVAVLIIVLGLMVSLARFVRNRSATLLTRDLLAHLDLALDRYMIRSHGLPPLVHPIAPPTAATLPDEPALLRAAEMNSTDVALAMRNELGALPFFAGVPISIYDRRTLRDAWGTPVALLPTKHPALGMAPQDRPFFVSAGPDRQFRTRADNLYSYEQTPLTPPGRVGEAVGGDAVTR
jgi:type II secretory pathway pseudopilin PulG